MFQPLLRADRIRHYQQLDRLSAQQVRECRRFLQERTTPALGRLDDLMVRVRREVNIISKCGEFEEMDLARQAITTIEINLAIARSPIAD